MKYQYVYTDERGERVIEDLTPEQFEADRRAVIEFECLEREQARERERGRELGPAHEVVISRIRNAASSLPPARKAHWLREMTRLGIAPTE